MVCKSKNTIDVIGKKDKYSYLETKIFALSVFQKQHICPSLIFEIKAEERKISPLL
jgi:hypothetical protein